jgi:hypothetical protein
MIFTAWGGWKPHIVGRGPKQGCVVGYISMKRALILVVAFGLAGLGPAPVSASAVLSGNLVMCVTPRVQTACDQMNMDANSARLLAASDSSCCFISDASLPGSRYTASDPIAAAAPTVVADPLGYAPRIRRIPTPHPARDSSPPPLQSLLCTFLI